MTPDDRKRRIEREITALERHSGDQVLPQKLSRLERLGDLYYEIDQFQDAYNKYHDYRTLGFSSGHLSSAEALAIRIKESWCLYERGALHETERSLEEAEALVRSLPSPDADALLAELHILYGYLEIRKSRYEESLARCDQAFRVLEKSGDDAALAKLQICFGHVYFRTGELARAREYYEDALASARRSSDSRRLVQAMINLALVCKEQSDHDRALYLLEQAKNILNQTGNFSYRGHVLLNKAVIHSHRGDLQLAEEAYRDSLQIYLQTGQQQCAALARIGLARGQALRGKIAEAKSLLQSTLEFCQERGYLREEVLIRRDLGDLERSQGDPNEALRLYEEARVAALPLGDTSEHVVQIGRRVGLALLRLGREKEAATELRRAAVRARRIGERYEEAVLTCSLGTLAAQEAHWDEFEKMYRSGIDMLRKMGERIELAKALVRHVRLGLGNVRNEEVDFQLELAEARKIFDEAGLPLWVGKTRLEEARLFARDQFSEKSEAALAEAEQIFSRAGDPRLVDRVDQLRRVVEERIVDHAVGRANDHLAIHDLLPVSSEALDLKTLLADLVSRTEGSRAILMIDEGEDDVPAERALHGLSRDSAKKVIHTLRNVIQRCRRGGRPFLSTAVATDPRISGEAISNRGLIRSILLVPFQTNAEISGAIYLDREEHQTPFGSREVDLVVGLARSQRFALSLLSSRQRELLEENTRLRKQVGRSDHFDQIVTQSPRMDDVLDLVRKVAGTNVTVLIQGETGTGKQLIAQAIHSESPRGEETFYSINCATLPEQLLESELFGHAVGSFTGAHADKSGLLAVASGSTVFLDEIDKMNLRVQSKLLHVLEEKRIRPLGSNRYIDIDVRFVCASNRNLYREVQEGRFLEDLYYRLNVINIDLPPLRDRVEDILLLAHYFLRIFSAEMGKEPVRIDETASHALVRYRWPGNVRELRSEMRRLVVLSEGGVVGWEQLSPALRGVAGGAATGGSPPASTGSLRERMGRYEKELLRRELERNGGNVSRTARHLGISRWGLHKKLDRHGLR